MVTALLHTLLMPEEDFSSETANLTLSLVQPGCRREGGQEGFCGAYFSVGRNKVSPTSNYGSKSSLKSSRLGMGSFPRGITLFKSISTKLNFVCMAEKAGFSFIPGFPFHCEQCLIFFPPYFLNSIPELRKSTAVSDPVKLGMFYIVSQITHALQHNPKPHHS